MSDDLSEDLAIHVENWGWFVQFTPAFIGSGMLVGLNVSISFFMGSVIAWCVANSDGGASKLIESGESLVRPLSIIMSRSVNCFTRMIRNGAKS